VLQASASKQPPNECCPDAALDTRTNCCRAAFSVANGSLGNSRLHIQGDDVR
jgi:hypothetical protein